MVRLYFLGEQRVGAWEAPAAPSLVVGRALELLAFLVVHDGVPQERLRLAALLWPESSEVQARTNLRRELHTLRQLPGLGDCLVPVGTALLWRAGAAWGSDLADFREHRRQALGADTRQLLAQGPAALQDYTGELLPALYSDWVVAERDALHRQCVELCDAVAQAAAGSDPGLALTAARRRVSLEPLEESGYQRLMELHQAAGDVAAAVRSYHRCAAVLERELGVGPGPRTRALAQELLGHAAPHPTGAEPRPRRAAGAGYRAVGRAAEVALLRQHWAEAMAGRPGLLLVLGDAGVGKTRLLQASLALARADHAVTAYARCYAGAGRSALAPVAAWLAAPELAAPQPGGTARGPERLTRLLPAPADIAQPGQGLLGAWQRRAFYESVARAVLQPARPTLLVLDDLQWCDEETVEWLSVLFAVAGTAPLLVVAAARPEALAGNPATQAAWDVLRAAWPVRELLLAPLPEAGSAALAASVLGHPLSLADARLLHAASGGYPLHIVETLRGVGRESVPAVLARAVPGRGVLRHRLEQCSPTARHVASLVAAMGREISLEVLLAAWDGADAELIAAVDELWRRRILIEQRGGYDFSHDLLRQGAYELATPPQQWLLHHRLAGALEGLHPGERDTVAAQLAEQYRRCGDTERAVGYFLQAGDAASRIFAHARAVADYRSALALLAARPAEPETSLRELTVLLRLPPSLTALRGYSSTRLRGTLERIIALAAELGRGEEHAAALIGLFAATFVQGHTALSHRIAEQALERAAAFPRLRGQAHFAVAGAATSLGRVQEALGHFTAACQQEPHEHSYILGTRIEIHARAWAAHAAWLAGDTAGAVAFSDEALDRAVHAEHPYSHAVALAYRALLWQLRLRARDADPELAAELAGTAVALQALCTRFSFAYYGQWGAILHGWLVGGARGLSTMRRAMEELRAIEAMARMPYWQCLLAQTLGDTGRTVEALGVLGAATAGARQRDDLWWLPEILRQRALLGPRDEAPALLRQALDMARAQGSAALVARVRETSRGG